MRVIKRKIPARVSVKYQCKKCKGRYGSKKNALKCEAQPIEAKLFHIGAAVTWREKRTCSAHDKTYSLRGKVSKILGPMLVDEEYDIKWLQRKLSGKHVFQYEVEWRCPYCHMKVEGLFYGMELIKVKK